MARPPEERKRIAADAAWRYNVRKRAIAEGKPVPDVAVRRTLDHQRARAEAAESAAGSSGTPTAPEALLLQGLRLGIAYGDRVYCTDLLPGEALQLAMRLFAEIGISVQLTPVSDREAPRALPASTPVAMLKAAGNA